MQESKHAFLDLSVMTELRMLMLSPAPTILFSRDLSFVHWANAAGSQFFSGSDISDTLQTRLNPDQPFIKSLSRSLAKLGKGRKIYQGFRYLQDGKTRFIQFSASEIQLADGELAVLICVELKREEKQVKEVEVAESLVSALEGLAHSAAVLNAKGKVIAASSKFSSLQIPVGQLEKLCKEVSKDSDRLIKRPIVAGDGRDVAVGIAHLEQKRNLLVFVEFGNEAEVGKGSRKQEVLEPMPDEAVSPEGELPLVFEPQEDDTTIEYGDTAKPGDAVISQKQSDTFSMPEQTGPEQTEPEQTEPEQTEEALVRVRSKNSFQGRVQTGLEEQNEEEIDGDDGDKNNLQSILARVDDGARDIEEVDIEGAGDEEIESIAIQSQPDEVLVDGLEPDELDIVEISGDHETQKENTLPAHGQISQKALRFGFNIDDEQVFQAISDELAEAVGGNASDVVGRSWKDVAQRLGFDSYGSIARLLEGRDTWSGKAVLWPVSETDMCVPVDLGALPVFDSAKNFRGFKGFGVVRQEDAMLDPESRGTNLVPWSEFDERSVDSEPVGDNVVALRGLKSSDDALPTQFVARNEMEEPRAPLLNEQEAMAFDEIGKHLGEINGIEKDHKPDNFDHGPDEDERLADERMLEAQASLPQEPDWVEDEEADQKYDESVANGISGPDEGVKLDDDKFADGPEHAVENKGVNTEILEQLPSPVIIYRDDQVLFVNHVLLERAGYHDRQELQKNGGIDIILDMHDIGGKEQMVFKTANGGRYPVNPVLQTVPWDDEKALLLSFNISGDVIPMDEKLALDMARVSELQGILDTATDGIIILDGEGNIESINVSAEELLGYRDLDMAGEPMSSLFAPESHERLKQYISQYHENGLGRLVNEGCELTGLERNGGLVPLYVTIGRSGNNGKLCAVLRDLTQWKKVEEELVNARREAETASEHKSEFLARVSHELRNPLNSIIGFSDVMIDEQFGPLGNERYREYLRDINRSGVHVLDLINDLLDLSKIEAGRLELSFEAIDINQIVAETVALLQPQANNERVLIRTSLSRAVPNVVADAKSIRQIVLNLVSNAIKFSSPGGQVIVSNVYETNGEVALRVRDTGEGMSPEEISIAMQPFHQVQSISRHRTDGTGLGLPLTKALVEANRAYFDIESEKHSGTIVHVQFPAQRVLKE